MLALSNRVKFKNIQEMNGSSFETIHNVSACQLDVLVT